MLFSSPVLVALLLSLALMSCSTPLRSTFIPEPDLLQDWSPEAQRAEPYAPPFVMRYTNAPKTLSFIAARHSKSVASGTFQLVKQEIEKQKPSLVIIEGQDSNRAAAAILERARQCEKEQFTTCGESLYAAYIAAQNGIPFIGGESPDESIFRVIKQKGYTAEDLAGFYAVRMVANHPPTDFIDRVKRVSISLEQTLEAVGVPKQSFRYPEFRQWFHQRTGLPFDRTPIDPQAIAPAQPTSFPQLQALAFEITRARNIHLLNLIAQELERHNRMLVVFGAGHHVELTRALHALFKNSAAEKPISTP